MQDLNHSQLKEVNKNRIMYQQQQQMTSLLMFNGALLQNGSELIADSLTGSL